MIRGLSTRFATTTAVFAALVTAGNIHKEGLTLPEDAGTNRDLVKSVFLGAYNAYKEKAWDHDDLAPVSGTFKNPRNGWGASLFDAMGTLKIMGEEELFKEAVSYASQVDFSQSRTSDHVSFFETTIRYIGGLLASYDLNGQSDGGLLANAAKLADKLLYAYPGGNYVIPVGFLDFSNNTPDVGDGGPNGIAAAASNILEFYKLSQYTGNKTYLEFGDLTMRAIAKNPEPVFPGLPPASVNSDGSGSGSSVHWDGGSDSYLEYLIKYARLTNFEDPLWAKTWTDAAESTIQHLIKQSSGGSKPWFITPYDKEGGNQYSMGELACFAGGNLIMGGRLLDRDDIVDWGLKVTDGCMSTYNTATGLGVGSWGFRGEDGGGEVPAEHQDFFDQNGWYPGAKDWNVRPEVFESVFYAWRATGDSKYYDFNARGIRAIEKYCKSNNGYAALKDVMNGNAGPDNHIDDLESFFFAEVMKYLYLTFDDPEHISLDKWVFNTESHPLLPANVTSPAPTPAPDSPPTGGEGDEDDSCDEDDEDSTPPTETAPPASEPVDDDSCVNEDGDDDTPDPSTDGDSGETCDADEEEDVPGPDDGAEQDDGPEQPIEEPDCEDGE